jgi:iron complex outermembrane receptor protein
MRPRLASRPRLAAAVLAVLAALVALAPASPLAAQAPASVRGRVIDASTGLPVADAEVRLDDERGLTGADGEFAFGSLRPGARRLVVRRVGYAPHGESLSLAPAEAREVAVRLAPAPVVLDSVVALADAPLAPTLAGEALVRRGSDLARALEGWEGIANRRTSASGGAAPQVRGGAPEEVLVLVDGFAANDPLTGRADLARIASADVERVTLLPGARTAQAGARAVAAVILVETRARIRPEARVWAGTRSAAGARLGGSLGPASLSASVERFPDEYPYDVPINRGSGEARRRNAGGVVASGSAAASHGDLRLTARASASERGLPGDVSNPTLHARAADRTLLVGLRSDERRISWAVSAQWIRTAARDTAPPNRREAYDVRTRGLGVTAELGWRADASAGGWTGSAGVGLDGRWDDFSGDGVREAARFRRAGVRAHAGWRRGPWTVEPALRADVWDGRSSPAPSARVDVAWRRGAHALTGSLGSAVTAPVLIDLLFREGVGVRLNSELRPERVRFEVEAGYRYEGAPLGVPGSASVRGYIGRVDDMVLWAPDFNFIWSPRNFDVWRRGAELSLELRPAARVRVDAGVGVASVTHDSLGGPGAAYRPRTTALVSAEWEPGPWTLAARFRHVGLRFRDTGGIGPVNRLAPIPLLEASIERRLSTGAAVRLDALDITDTRAQFIAGFPTPGRSFILTLDLSLP